MERRIAERRSGIDRRAPEPTPVRPLADRDLDWLSKLARVNRRAS